MQCVSSLVANPAMESGELVDGFLSVLAAFLAATYHLLEPFEVLQPSFEVPRIEDDLSVGDSGQGFHPQVDPHHRSGILGYCLLFFYLETHIPVSRLLAHRGREDPHATGR